MTQRCDDIFAACESSTYGSELVAISIAQDWISRLWLNWRILVFLYKDQLIHMVIIMPWLRTQIFLNQHWVRNSIWSIIILYANLLQLDDKNCNEDTETLLRFCIQIKWHCCIFSWIIGMLIWEFSSWLRFLSLLLYKQGFVLLSGFPSCQAYGEHILAYLRIDLLSLRGERLKYDSRLKSLLRVNIR